MAVIFGDRKKIAPVAVRMQDGETHPDDDMAVLKALADEVIQAVKSGSADKLAMALKAIHHECEEYEEGED